MTRILISAALETDWEDREEGYAAHSGNAMPFGFRLRLGLMFKFKDNSDAERFCRFVGSMWQIVQFNL